MFPFLPSKSLQLSGSGGEPPRRSDLSIGAGCEVGSQKKAAARSALIALLGEAGAKWFADDKHLDEFIRVLDEERVTLGDHAHVVKLFERYCEGTAERNKHVLRRRRESGGEEFSPASSARREKAEFQALTSADATSVEGLKGMFAIERTFNGKSRRQIEEFLTCVSESGVDPTDKASVAELYVAFVVSMRSREPVYRGSFSNREKVDEVGVAPREEPGKRPNEFGDDQLNPLMRAAKNGRADEVARMLNDGGDPTLISPRPEKPEEVAYKRLQVSVNRYLRYVRSGGAGVGDPPGKFVEEGLMRFFPSLRHEPASRPQVAGMNALTLALASGAGDDVVATICSWSRNCEPESVGAGLLNQPDGLGNTPITTAVGSQNVKCIALLIAAGADLEKSDERGMTPLMHATYNCDPNMVKALLEWGAHSFPQSASGASPLSLAIACQNSTNVKAGAAVIKILLESFPRDCERVCDGANLDRLAKRGLNSFLVLRQTIMAIFQYGVKVAASGDRELAEYCEGSLAACFKVAVERLNGVDLLELALFQPIKNVSEHARIEALFSGLAKLPKYWAELFMLNRSKTNERSVLFSAFEHTMRQVARIDSEARTASDQALLKLAADCAQSMLAAACEMANIFDLARLFWFVRVSPGAERFTEAVVLMLERMPVEWGKCLRSTLATGHDHEFDEELFDPIAQMFYDLASMAKDGSVDLKPAAEKCLKIMWDLAFELMPPRSRESFAQSTQIDMT